MDTFVATQPIFDQKLNVVAYELLYRSGIENLYTFDRPDAASSRVISQFDGSARIYTNGKPAYINFTEELLLSEIALVFPKDDIVVEILEDVEPTPEVVEKVRALKEEGYTIALDDFEKRDELEPLIELADILKVDFMQSDEAHVILYSREYRDKKILLAEKIETDENYERARKLGYRLYQGYFFSKPKIYAQKEVTPLKANHLRLLKLCNSRFINFHRIGQIVNDDVALTLKLLRLVNSCAFPHRNRITNVKSAVSFLGEAMLRRWVSLITLTDLNADRPSELIRLSMIRAKFGENIAPLYHPPRDADDVFLLGMFSLLNIAIESDFDDIMEDVAISSDVKQALVSQQGPFGDMIPFYRSYEHADWDAIEVYAKEHDLNLDQVSNAYINAMVWYNDFMRDLNDNSHDGEYVK